MTRTLRLLQRELADELVEACGVLEVEPMVEALEGDVAAAGDQSAHRLAAARREAAAVGAVQVEAGQRDAPGGGRQVTVCAQAEAHHTRFWPPLHTATASITDG